ITADALAAILDNLVPPIKAAGTDGVLLHLHGAGAAENAPDPEAVVLREVRAAVGRAMVEAAPLQLMIRERKTGASFVVAIGASDTRGGALVDVVMVDEGSPSTSD
ncbi:MAG: M81 family metallopeptidase, partial [Dehalococcoidia bacterium]|nr:M81 family metallopeptidase [Dehalococcoidia bacterium]